MNARRLVAAVVVVSSIVLVARVRADEPPFRTAPETPFLIEHIALDLDVDAFRRSLDRHAHRGEVSRDLDEAHSAPTQATPMFRVGGRWVVGDVGADALNEAVGDALAASH